MQIIDKASMQTAIDTLNEWTAAYDEGHPAVSDKEWDDLYFALKDAEDALGIILPNSPTQNIVYEVVSELKKVKHEYRPMLSLDKTKDIEEIKEFIKDKDWIAMLKLDGLSCRLTYKDGKLFRAETRGNGIEGEDITHNARVISSIPKKIPYKDTLVVDGEIICDLETFEKFKDEYANARNFAAGSIRLLDSAECAKRGLTFVAWDAITGYEEDEDNTLSKRLTQLIDYYFQVVPFTTTDEEDPIEWLKAANDKYTHYPIDGIVFKWNNCAEYQAAGRTGHHFRGGLAYKFYDEEYETELLDIDWTMGRTGILTPIAVFKDVDTGDSIVNRANLHNLNTMREVLGAPYKSQPIWIFKANQIIPQVSRSEKTEPGTAHEWINIPQLCPYCGGSTIVKVSDSGTEELYCDNDQCDSKLINKLEHFAGKKGLDIKGLSKATLEKLIDWGWLDSAKGLFKLNDYRDEWIKKPGFGVKSVDKALNAIEDARKADLAQYLSAISIPLIGKVYSQQLAQIFDSYEAFRIAVVSGFDFSTIEGFGPAMHEAIVNFDYYEADRMVDMKMVEIVTKDESQRNFESAHPLDGKIICITGRLKAVSNREEMIKLIEFYGGKVTSSVSKNTSYLINNDKQSHSNKNLTAQKLGVTILTEEEFLSLIKE